MDIRELLEKMDLNEFGPGFGFAAQRPQIGGSWHSSPNIGGQVTSYDETQGRFRTPQEHADYIKRKRRNQILGAAAVGVGIGAKVLHSKWKKGKATQAAVPKELTPVEHAKKAWSGVKDQVKNPFKTAANAWKDRSYKKQQRRLETKKRQSEIEAQRLKFEKQIAANKYEKEKAARKLKTEDRICATSDLIFEMPVRDVVKLLSEQYQYGYVMPHPEMMFDYEYFDEPSQPRRSLLRRTLKTVALTGLGITSLGAAGWYGAFGKRNQALLKKKVRKLINMALRTGKTPEWLAQQLKDVGLAVDKKDAKVRRMPRTPEPEVQKADPEVIRDRIYRTRSADQKTKGFTQKESPKTEPAAIRKKIRRSALRYGKPALHSDSKNPNPRVPGIRGVRTTPPPKVEKPGVETKKEEPQKASVEQKSTEAKKPKTVSSKPALAVERFKLPQKTLTEYHSVVSKVQNSKYMTQDQKRYVLKRLRNTLQFSTNAHPELKGQKIVHPEAANLFSDKYRAPLAKAAGSLILSDNDEPSISNETVTSFNAQMKKRFGKRAELVGEDKAYYVQNLPNYLPLKTTTRDTGKKAKETLTPVSDFYRFIGSLADGQFVSHPVHTQWKANILKDAKDMGADTADYSKVDWEGINQASGNAYKSVLNFFQSFKKNKLKSWEPVVYFGSKDDPERQLKGFEFLKGIPIGAPARRHVSDRVEYWGKVLRMFEHAGVTPPRWIKWELGKAAAYMGTDAYKEKAGKNAKDPSTILKVIFGRDLTWPDITTKTIARRSQAYNKQWMEQQQDEN